MISEIKDALSMNSNDRKRVAIKETADPISATTAAQIPSARCVSGDVHMGQSAVPMPMGSNTSIRTTISNTVSMAFIPHSVPPTLDLVASRHDCRPQASLPRA